MSAAEFLRERIEVSGSCWIWTGAKTGACGYGMVRVRGRATTAHRHVWMLEHGEVPAGLFVCHRCNRKACVRPDHLYLADNAQNIRDAHADGLITTANEKKTACGNCGGQYRFNAAGRRICDPCRRASAKRSRDAARAAIDAAREEKPRE